MSSIVGRLLRPAQSEARKPATLQLVRPVQRWPAFMAILGAILLYVTLPNHLYYGPRWAIPVVEGALLVGVLVADQSDEHHWVRRIVIGLITIINAANVGSLLLLVHALVANTPIHGQKINAQDLIFWSAQIWSTNVLVFGLWYWILDRGGPYLRSHAQPLKPDFLFPQLVNPAVAEPDWAPGFFDYLYVSLTNATAFSPTDTMPLTGSAKFLMMIQSIASLLTVVLVAARAVNILQ